MASPSELQNILVALGSVPKNADKATLIATIDAAVDGVISAVDEIDGNAMPPDLVKTTMVTLEFLEQCGKLGDAAFRDHIRARAVELQQKLQATTKAASAAKPAEEPTHESFEAAFADHFCAFLRRRLEAFHVTSAAKPPFPYVLNPAFADVFLAAVRKHVLPDVLKNRRIRNMADSVAVSELTRSFFFEEFAKPANENVVVVLWTGIMDDFRAALAPPAAAADQKGKASGKGGGLSGLLGKGKAAKAPPKKTASGDRYAKAEAFLKDLQKDAEDHGFDPPRAEDFSFFRVLMEYKPGVIEDNKRALTQLLKQESMEDEDLKAREGATRDWLYRIVDRLPPHCGELLALWAYRTYGELFNKQMLRSFLAGQGTTDEKRQQAVPMFWRWLKEELG